MVEVPQFWTPRVVSMLASPGRPQVFVPVKAVGATIVDNGGDVIADCFIPAVAQRVAWLLNRDAGAPCMTANAQ